MAGRRLPAEVLDTLFSYLPTEDIVSCSGVNRLWYETAKRRLARKHGIQLCRSSDRILSKSQDVCLAGDGTGHCILFAERKLKRLHTLRIQYDEPSDLRKPLDIVFTSCKNLKRLELLNLTYISENGINSILEHCSPGFELRLSLRDRRKSKAALAALEENRELFQEILVECMHCIEGWYPTPLQNSKFTIPETSTTVSLECLGLIEIECRSFNILRTLKLEKCSALSENSLYAMSRLNVTKLSISECLASEATWWKCIKFGFRNLQDISIVECQNLTAAVIEALATKDLTHIKLEINKSLEISGLPHLHTLFRLESLHIISDQIISNCIQKGVETHWRNLRRLQIEEDSLFHEDNVDVLERVTKMKRIEFIRRIRPIKITEISYCNSPFQIQD